MTVVTMDHAAAQALFSDYADDELSAADRARLDEHLHGCEACRGELATFESTLAALRANKAEASADLGPEFMDNLRSQIRVRSRGRFFGDPSQAKKRSYRIEIASLITLLLATTIYVVLSLVEPMWLVR